MTGGSRMRPRYKSWRISLGGRATTMNAQKPSLSAARLGPYRPVCERRPSRALTEFLTASASADCESG